MAVTLQQIWQSHWAALKLCYAEHVRWLPCPDVKPYKHCVLITLGAVNDTCLAPVADCFNV